MQPRLLQPPYLVLVFAFGGGQCGRRAFTRDGSSCFLVKRGSQTRDNTPRTDVSVRQGHLLQLRRHDDARDKLPANKHGRVRIQAQLATSGGHEGSQGSRMSGEGPVQSESQAGSLALPKADSVAIKAVSLTPSS